MISSETYLRHHQIYDWNKDEVLAAYSSLSSLEKLLSSNFQQYNQWMRVHEIRVLSSPLAPSGNEGPGLLGELQLYSGHIP